MSTLIPDDIQNVGSDTYILMAKGHHDPHEFMRIVRLAGYQWPLGMPTHQWVKTVPSRDPGYRCHYALVDKGTRGAWPATYAHEAYHEDGYEAIVAATKEPRNG